MCDRRTKAPPKAKAPAARSEQTTKANATTRTVIAEIQRVGETTLAAIARELEARGVRTLAGRNWPSPMQVARLLADWADLGAPMKPGAVKRAEPAGRN